jgi:DNA-binding transcriptional LysR family regulator
MKVRKLEYLIALAKEGHFSRAAAACHVSQPTLSTALRQLEVEMGVLIVKRGQRYSGFTEQGERVLAFAHRMAAECEHLRRELESRGGDSQGTLQVGVIPSALSIVSSLTVPFHRDHPRVNVRIIDLNPADIQRAFEEFTLDVAITYLDEKVRTQGRNHQLYLEEYSLLISKSSSLSRLTSVSWQEASKLSLCFLASEMQSPNSRARDLLGRRTPNSADIEMNSVTALASHVRSGVWASVLPRPLAMDLQADDCLECIPLPPLKDPACVGIMIPDRDLTFPLAEAFFNLAVSERGACRPRETTLSG